MIDWIAIEGEYLAGTASVNAVANAHGVSEGAIRARAKKYGWVRAPNTVKREMVKAAMSGVTNAITNDATNLAVRNIEAEAAQDVADMQGALGVSRACINRLGGMAETAEDPRDIKVIAEANNAAVNTIRRIRGLDEQPAPAAGGVQAMMVIQIAGQQVDVKALGWMP